MNKAEIGDKVVLYGFCDGFSYETNGTTNIITALETGERVEVPIECVIKKDQVVKKDEIKLKDIIRRVNRLDENSKTYWLDTILNWFSLDFGLTKYRQGYEQGKFEGMLERDKVKIPQAIAKYIKQTKNEDYHLLGAMTEIRSHKNKVIDDWFYTDDNMELFARAWLDGYEVEKEKRYLVKMKGIAKYKNYLVFGKISRTWFFASVKTYDVTFTHTRKQLEDAGFGWVFDCEGIEIEEVEG